MGLKVAFQMDPIERINILEDTTFHLALKAQELGHSLFYFTPNNLSYQNGRLLARGHYFTLKKTFGDHVNLQDEQVIDLEQELDVIWLRQDPPFDMSYVTNTHLLDLLKEKVLVVNNSFWVRNFPEKISVLNFPNIIPPTIISRDIKIIRRFQKQMGDLIIKPLFGNGGHGIFKVSEGDPNINALLEMFFSYSKEPVIVQKFLPQVSKGDKRIIILDGEPIGAINRVPQQGEVRSNMHVGGVPEKVDLSVRDLEICSQIAPMLKDNNLLFVGIDIIGEFLTEINLTSPTGLQEIERFNKVDLAKKIWSVIDRKVASIQK